MMTTTQNQSPAPSSDHTPDGIEVIRGIGRTTVASAEYLQDDDLVTIDGMQMPAHMALEYGLITTGTRPATTPDPSQSVAAEQTDDDKPRPQTGHEGYDRVASDIMDRVDAGILDGQEAFEYDLAVATVASADLTISEVVDIIDGIESGELNALDLDTNSRQVAQSVEQRVTQSATKAAIGELGQQGFDRLSQMAAASPVVDQAIRQYVSMRALGRSSDTWSDFLAMAEDEMAGRA